MYDKICSLGNLLLAYKKARKGKTKRRYVKRFEENLIGKIKKLQEELISQTYKPHKLKTFILRDPKTRKISKSAFRDRVVHHALCNLIVPVFEKSFIYDSHANQIGKGTHKALERFDKFKRKVSRNNTKNCYVLKADIKHYFEEIDHEVLINIVSRKIKDEKVIWLIKQILKNSWGGASDFAMGLARSLKRGREKNEFFKKECLLAT
ncbi:MAG: reverse transcriptase domain-containing protein [Nanoarchaeota archaeon]|mgnify:CR=1 FL=1